MIIYQEVSSRSLTSLKVQKPSFFGCQSQLSFQGTTGHSGDLAFRAAQRASVGAWWMVTFHSWRVETFGRNYGWFMSEATSTVASRFTMIIKAWGCEELVWNLWSCAFCWSWAWTQGPWKTSDVHLQREGQTGILYLQLFFPGMRMLQDVHSLKPT